MCMACDMQRYNYLQENYLNACVLDSKKSEHLRLKGTFVIPTSLYVLAMALFKLPHMARLAGFRHFD